MSEPQTFSHIDEVLYEFMPDRYEEKLMEDPGAYGRYVAHQLLNDFREDLGQKSVEWDPVNDRPVRPTPPESGGASDD